MAKLSKTDKAKVIRMLDVTYSCVFGCYPSNEITKEEKNIIKRFSKEFSEETAKNINTILIEKASEDSRFGDFVSDAKRMIYAEKHRPSSIILFHLFLIADLNAELGNSYKELYHVADAEELMLFNAITTSTTKGLNKTNHYTKKLKIATNFWK